MAEQATDTLLAEETLLATVLAEDEDAVLAEDELLVEEISIDGMCGVY